MPRQRRTEFVAFYATPSLKAAIRALAEAEGRAVSDYLRRLCEKAVKDKKSAAA